MGVDFSEILRFETRLQNWRRFYRTSQQMHCVPYYTPPRVGDTVDTTDFAKDRIKINPERQDAELIERVWVSLPEPQKLLIKHHYVKLSPIDQIRRQLKKLGIVTKSPNEYHEQRLKAIRMMIRAT